MTTQYSSGRGPSGTIFAFLLALLLGAATMVVFLRHATTGFLAHVADRIAFIDAGRIIAHGPPRQVFHESSEPRLRQFLQTYHDRNAF